MTFRFVIAMTALATCMVLLGCGTGPAETSSSPNAPSEAASNHAAHDHAAPGPHGGHLVVLGEEEYHAELTHDEATHTVAVYLLDGTAKVPVSDGPAEIVLQVFQQGDFADHVLKASGDDGAYVLADEPLCHLLLHGELKGRVHAAIVGEEYVGIIELAGHAHDAHRAHAHGDQDHDGDDHDGHDQDDGHAHGAEDTDHDHEGHDAR